MKKSLLLAFALILFGIGKATVFYVSPTGNDATGTGTAANPWKTLYKATNSVTTPGDIIYVTAGTYLETQQSALRVGVSLTGDGAGSVTLRSTLTANFTAMLSLTSGSVTNGNQSISNLKFDGQYVSEASRGTNLGIYIAKRSNVEIKNCVITGFYDRGVIFTVQEGADLSEPATNATGNSFHDNTLTNCAAYNTSYGIYGRGCLNFGGQTGMLIYNNTITQTQRAQGYNGWPIKGFNDGWNKGCKIYNNTITKLPYTGAYPGENGWPFAIELFNEHGMEIYGNTIQGAIDANFNTKGTYAYGFWIHDNIISQPTLTDKEEAGITLEYETGDAIIENNIIFNIARGIMFVPRSGTPITNVIIRNNLIYDIGRLGLNGNNGGAIHFYSDNADYTVNGFYVYNNTFSAKIGSAPYGGILFNGSGACTNLQIKNNIFQNFNNGWLWVWSSNIYSNMAVTHNNAYNNGGANNPYYQAGTPTSSYTASNNTTNVPGFVGGTNYTLAAGSANIDAGVNVGLPYSGSAPDKGYKESGSVGNASPAASAGADQTITLPTSSVTLTGSGTDPDGTIASYAWTKVSGPAGGTIASPAAASTNITALAAGTYVFRLTVTDNLGATGTDDIQVIVNPAANQAPTANAGPDQTITLPTSSVTLTGSGTDPDGTIASYAWTKFSGPAGGTIATPAVASTNVTGLVAGTYVYRLTVTDNGGATATNDVQIIVNAAANQAPTANAGPAITITLPTSTATLNGSGTDPDGTISTYAWTKVSGPAGGAITTPATASTNITGLIAGTYVYRLTVTDNGGATATNDVQIIVNSAPNQAPSANAGPDQTITLPTSSVTLVGSGTDPDGTIASYAWTKVSGPAGTTISSPGTLSTNITGLTAGTFVFRLTVTDNGGATAFDDVQIIVNNPPLPPPNVAPTANAGTNQTITLPTSSVSFVGSGTDPDGTIASYAWTKVSGPAGGTIASPGAATTNVTGLTAGTYTFRLTVTDNAGATGTDDIQVVVNSAPPANVAPTANAGGNQTITLPTSTATLNGSGTDPDGTIASYAWTKVSGPAGGTIGSPAAASTTINGMATAGTYVYRLTVTDNAGATAFDDVQITVNSAPAPPPNKAPTANAGADITLTLPTSSTTLTGSGTDPDGIIYTYTWTKVSGPAGDAIGSPTQASTGISGLNTAGIYVYRLTVADNGGATATDDVQIIVNNATAPVPSTNLPPVANPGNDANFNLPNANSTNLDGTSSYDPDGNITKWAWKLISGPSGSTITNSTTATAGFTATRKGTYTVELMVTDNGGLSSTKRKYIYVSKTNKGPRAMTTYDTTTVISQNTLLEGSTSFDADGTITAYKWSYVSGPSSYKILNPDSANTVVANLSNGTYQFALEVMDDDSAIDKKLVTVVVKSKTARREILEVKLYPNPAVNDVYVTVNADVQGRSTLILFDEKGAPVYKETFDKASFSVTRNIKVGGLRKGTYFVVVQVDNSAKMIKKLMVL